MRTINIPAEEVEWIPSTADPVGRVFLWKNRLYRAIRDDYSPFYLRLFKENIFTILTKKGFMPKNHITNLHLDGFNMIIEHEKLDFPSYPFEWCGEMFRDAAILMCDLSIALHANKLTLKDAHPYNVMFDGVVPKFIDIGSIIHEENHQKWFISGDFLVDIITPLQAISSGLSEEVRDLLRFELDINRIRKKLTDLLSVWNRLTYLEIKLRNKLSTTDNTIKFYKVLLQNINLQSSKTEWSEYAKNDDDYFLPFDSQNRWFDKQKNVNLILKKLKPLTVHDIGSNVGWYAELAARNRAKVVASDIDEPSLNELFLRSKAKKLDIQPVIIDFVKSTASNITWTGTSDRYKADMVLALALTHHLVFKNNLNFDTICQELAKYTKKWLVVEFVPANDKYIKDWVKKEHDWYTQENFSRSLQKIFTRIEIFDSTPHPRKLLFCSK